MKSSIEVIIFHLFLYIHSSSSITPEQWVSSTDSNIEKAEAECKASASLRGVIDSVLNQCTQDIESQRAKVNLAFEKRTQEITDAKQTLEQHLEKVNFYANGSFCVMAYSCGILSLHGLVPSASIVVAYRGISHTQWLEEVVCPEIPYP